jgi:hypothetical protein
MRKGKQQRPKAKRSLSTVPHLDTLREFDRDCREKGMRPSERLRQILDQYYSNERLKSLGRDVAESPIRNLQKQAISEEVSPLKNKMAEVEKAVQTVRSIVEDILGGIAQMSMQACDDSGEGIGKRLSHIESSISELAGFVEQFSECRRDAEEISNQRLTPPSTELVKELNSIKTLTANLAIRTLKETVRSAVQSELKERHIVFVDWSLGAGIDIYTVRKVVEEVTDPAAEISLHEARIRFGAEVRVGTQVKMNLLKRLDFVRVVAEAINQILQPGALEY